MRELTYFEADIVAGASEAERNVDRADAIETGIVAGTILGAYYGAGVTAGMAMPYVVGGMAVGSYAGIVAVPVLAKLGLELSYAVYDTLAP